VKRFIVLVERVGGHWVAHVGPLNSGPASNPAEALDQLANAFRTAALECMVDDIIRMFPDLAPKDGPHKL
jgi:hypothetical protein